MQVLIKTNEPTAAALFDLAPRRVRFVLRRLAWLVTRATIQLTDVNGPRGGVDKRCQVELKTDRSGTVVVTSTAPNWHAALEMALARAVRFLMRVRRRANDTRRLPHPSPDLVEPAELAQAEESAQADQTNHPPTVTARSSKELS